MRDAGQVLPDWRRCGFACGSLIRSQSEARRRRRGRRQQRHRLEQSCPSGRAPSAAPRPRISFAASIGIGLRSICSARAAMPRSARNSPWGLRAQDRGAAMPRRLAKAAKSTWAERSSSPGSASSVGEAMPAHRLQGFAKAGCLAIAIIQQQRRAAMLRDHDAAISSASAVAAGETS